MQRIRALTLYQKIVLLFLLMMALLFTILYPVTISCEGLLYEDTILLPEATETGMVYSGKIDGEAASFTVSGGGSDLPATGTNSTVPIRCGRTKRPSRRTASLAATRSGWRCTARTTCSFAARRSIRVDCCGSTMRTAALKISALQQSFRAES